jgi:glycosyltransferase involved in cell wall biosynthesis
VEDPALRARLGEAGREYVAQHYDWTENAQQMASIYERLLATRRPRRSAPGIVMDRKASSS